MPRDADHITVRGIDPQLWQEVRVQAIRHNMTVGEWLNGLLRREFGVSAPPAQPPDDARGET